MEKSREDIERDEIYCTSCGAMFELECCCEELEDEEPDGYECMGCGNIQGRSNGFGCDVCSGPMTEWYC